ncbi:MAG: thiamine phosphate synthase [Hyphomicrobiaceae bacterium]|nr:thiamine phosphate synthase [Hyphomicrobiaceae bacterium]
MTQMCVMVPADGLGLLSEAISAAPIAAVVIMPGADGVIAPAAALPLIAAAQQSGAAVLIYGDAQLARTLKADGVHLAWTVDVATVAEDARDILGQGGIVGADAGSSRHDAMELGELGVDYVAFGLGDGDPELARGDRDELVAWWAEIFEIPVVALDVASAEEAATLKGAHADFLSARLSLGSDAAKILSEISAAAPAAPTEPAA